MSDGVHLLIPFAANDAQGCRSMLQSLALPQLERLVTRLVPAERAGGDARSLSMPHELALARECGLGDRDGLLPWAAWQVEQAGRDAIGAAWAWITPCHWRVGADHVFMHHPQELQLDAADARALLTAMCPYFEEDGLQLEYDAPTRWLARGAMFADLPSASLDRVVGRVIDGWMPAGDTARPVRRLQQEMQMLLYTHPVNEERVRGGQLPVNSFWVSGTGELPPARGRAPAGLRLTHDLRDAALQQDWAAWAAAWRQLDEREVPLLQQALDRGEPVALTLCGDRHAQTWRSQDAGWARRLAAAFARKRAPDLLSDL